MPAGDVFGLDGFFLNKSNPITVSAVDINSTAAGAGITVVSGVLNAAAGIATLTFSTAAGLSTTPFYVGAKIAVSGLSVSGAAHTGYNGNFVVTGFAGTTTVSYATTGYFGSVTASISGQTGRVMLLTDTAVTNTTWSSAQTHGWFGGGGSGPTPTSVSTVDRIDFSNDTGTANIRGSLITSRWWLAATGNSNYGWFAGGVISSPSTTSTVERVDFSNDLASATSRGVLTSERYGLAATGNSNYGWFGGASFTDSSAIERIDFSNDSGTALPKGQLISPRAAFAATGNSNYGWFGGGQTYYQFSPGPPVRDDVQRIDFSNDLATSSIRGPLSLARGYHLAATGNSNYGWFAGGRTPSTAPSVTYSTVDRIDFSNDSVQASPRGVLTSARYQLAATGNSNYGWFGGEFSNSIIDRINFANDSVTASPRGPLSTTRMQLAATSGQARSSSVRLQKAGNFGWFGGGSIPGPSASLTVNRMDFSNDNASFPARGSLNSIREQLTATGNSNYGWFGGGYNGVVQRSTVERIDFSNDAAITSIRGPLSAERRSISAIGNSNYGWFSGAGPASINLDRIDFSNDSGEPKLRTGFNAPYIFNNAATGNSNYGWFGGGYSLSLAAPARNRSIVNRIDFSNDSSTASIRGPLGIAKYKLAATGNSNYGWFAGGITPSTPAYTAAIERIDFSNDSPIALFRGSLSTPANSQAATGNSNYGWFAGGINNPASAFPINRVERIDFSNDSATASVRGFLLSTNKSNLGATSNSTR